MRFRVGIRVGIGLVACLVSSDGLRAQVQFPGVQQTENATGDSIFVPAPRSTSDPFKKRKKRSAKASSPRRLIFWGKFWPMKRSKITFCPLRVEKGAG